MGKKKSKAFFTACCSLVFILIVAGWGWYHLSAPMVSVVMSVYNGTKDDYLHRSIPSILNQTFTDFEFIIIDDGSSDNSWEILRTYAAKDKRIKVFKNDRNRGISYSRNRGNDLARGKYIMIMDQDDDNQPDRMLKQVLYLEEHPWVDIVATPSITPFPWFGSPSVSVGKIPSEDEIKFSLFFSNNIGHPNIMVKRKFLTVHHIRYDEKIKCANDYDWLLQIRENKGRFAYMQEALFRYSGANYSATKKCSTESMRIQARFSGFRDENKRFCDIIYKILHTDIYADMFSSEYLKFLQDIENKAIKTKVCSRVVQ
ncbi:MAG: glycosyltransferase family 2 protein [Alphaproteobacteria bacterium]|nr:glycosyltransferase family 2 protein [Alphaproteobacteria bacterium]